MACGKVISEFEVLSADDVGRRRAWTVEDKVRIVEESLRGHRQGSAVARRYGVSRSLLTRWRSDYRAGRLGLAAPTFIAVATAASPPHQPPPARVREAPGLPTTAKVLEAAPMVEIVLGNGRRMIVPASMDPPVLARLLTVVDPR
jgi:transposase